MPSSTYEVLKEFLNGKKLSQKQWLDIVENRRTMIARCFDMFTLQTVEQLECLNSGHNVSHSLRADNPTIIDESGLPASRGQGVFAGTPFAQYKPGNICRTFGLSRTNGNWLLIEIEFSKQPNPYPPWTPYEKAETVRVTKSDLPTIISEVGVTPWVVLEFFKIVVGGWVRARKDSYETVCRVREDIDKEDAMLALISR